ncbi:hypothetical protein D3C84_973560 [compost metagenome]
MLIFATVPGRSLEPISTPAAFPCMACTAFCTGLDAISLAPTLTIDPVRSDFFFVPYPTTTTSSSLLPSSSILMLILV